MRFEDDEVDIGEQSNVKVHRFTAAKYGSYTIAFVSRARELLLNILELESRIIAAELGHKDGGKLVTQLYGHPDGQRARRRIREAFDSAAKVRPLRVVTQESA